MKIINKNKTITIIIIIVLILYNCDQYKSFIDVMTNKDSAKENNLYINDTKDYDIKSKSKSHRDHIKDDNIISFKQVNL